MTASTQSLKGTLLIIASALIWSTGGLFVRLIHGADSWTIVFWRSLTAALFLFGLLLWTEGRNWRAALTGMGLAGVAVGLCFTCASISLIIALNFTTVADVLIIMSAAPILAAALGWVVLREPISPMTLFAIIATIIGVGIIVWQGLTGVSGAKLIGDGFAALIAIAYAAAIVITRHNSHIAMTPAVFLGVVVAMFIALPLATPGALTLANAPLLFSFGALQLGLGLAVFAAGARLIPAAQTALLGTLEPILGPLWVWLFIGEQPGTPALIGGAIVLTAISLHTIFESRKLTPEPVAQP